jgi:hypothetical protein
MEGDRPDARLDTTAADDEQARYAHQGTLLLCSWHPHLADDNGFPRLRGERASRTSLRRCSRFVRSEGVGRSERRPAGFPSLRISSEAISFAMPG